MAGMESFWTTVPGLYATVLDVILVLLFLWFDPFQNTVGKPSRNTLFYQFYFIDMVFTPKYLISFENSLFTKISKGFG